MTGAERALDEAEQRRRDDHALARRCMDGDRSAQIRLFRDHERRVHRVLFRVFGSNDDMDDVIQDAFIEVFRSLPLYRGESRLGTWIDRITARVAYRYLKNRTLRPVPVSTFELVHDASAPDAHVGARELTRRVYAVVDSLEPTQRVAFTLAVLDGRTAREVASLTGVTLVAAKVRIWRAERAFHEKAKDDPELKELGE